MPLKKPPIGPFSAVYVGDAPPSVDPLTKILAKRTEGGFVNANTPEQWVPIIKNTAQSGEVEFRFECTFFQAGNQVIKLGMGNSLSTPREDDPSSFALYTVLLLDEDEDAPESIFIPVCRTVKTVGLNREKKVVRKLKVTFTYQERDRSIKLWYKDTLANLLALPAMAGRSPF